MLAFALAPIVAASAVAYCAVWPLPRALGHLAIMTAIGLLFIEIVLKGFDKVPFTCAYLPGKANLKVRLGVYAGGLMFGTEFVTAIEGAALKNPRGYAILMALTLAGWAWAARRGRDARIGLSSVRFEEQPDAPLLLLGLVGKD